ncbi:MAG: SIS domain-containing protein [Terriglobia bacterium]
MAEIEFWKNTLTKLLNDILEEPEQLSKSLAYSCGEGSEDLEKAAVLVRGAKHLYVVGIGSSWHAAMAILSLFNAAGRPALLLDASEMVHFTVVPRQSVVIILSRSGRSIEVVRMLEVLRSCGTRIIAVTNTADSALAKEADVCLKLAVRFDHHVSISVYSALALVGGLLASRAVDQLSEELVEHLAASLTATQRAMASWKERIDASTWFEREAATYFLARGGSLASCHEGRLLWEEAAKAPASAMSSGGFRHGPQEIVRNGLRIVMWLDREKLRTEDLALAADLRHNGTRVFLIGQSAGCDAAELVINLLGIPAAWQFPIDIIPAQLAAERLSRLQGEDCDAFLLCPYIIEQEGGLTMARIR